MHKKGPCYGSGRYGAVTGAFVFMSDVVGSGFSVDYAQAHYSGLEHKGKSAYDEM